jgi:hypothetical protein
MHELPHPANPSRFSPQPRAPAISFPRMPLKQPREDPNGSSVDGQHIGMACRHLVELPKLIRERFVLNRRTVEHRNICGPWLHLQPQAKQPLGGRIESPVSPHGATLRFAGMHFFGIDERDASWRDYVSPSTTPERVRAAVVNADHERSVGMSGESLRAIYRIQEQQSVVSRRDLNDIQ